jgi:hypothetical protein
MSLPKLILIIAAFYYIGAAAMHPTVPPTDVSIASAHSDTISPLSAAQAACGADIVVSIDASLNRAECQLSNGQIVTTSIQK